MLSENHKGQKKSDKGTQCEDNERNDREEGGCQGHDCGSHLERRWSGRTSEKKPRQSGPQEEAAAVLGQRRFVPTRVGEMPQKPNPAHVH